VDLSPLSHELTVQQDLEDLCQLSSPILKIDQTISLRSSSIARFQ
jgi:hypothetical protein